MDTSVGSIQLAHLIIEGAVIAVSIELVVRCIFSPNNQKSWLIRGLRIVMALAMTIKSSLFAAFSTSALGEHSCRLAGKLADVFFHISSLAGLYILLLRVMVLIPSKNKTFFMTLHACFMVIRLALGVADTVFSHVWIDINTGVCRYRDLNQSGVAYTVFDFLLDVYVSTTVTYILSNHIRNVKNMGVKGNVALYVSVVLSNVFRSLILSVSNLTSTVYFIVSRDNPITDLIVWPINNLFFIILIGYDTNITNSLSSLQSYIFRARQQQQKHHAQVSGNYESASSIINEAGIPLRDIKAKSTQTYSPLSPSKNEGFEDTVSSTATTTDTASDNVSTANNSTVLDMSAVNSNPIVRIQHSSEYS